MSAGGHVKDSGRDEEGRSQSNRGLGAYRDSHMGLSLTKARIWSGGKKRKKMKGRQRTQEPLQKGASGWLGASRTAWDCVGARYPEAPSLSFWQLFHFHEKQVSLLTAAHYGWNNQRWYRIIIYKLFCIRGWWFSCLLADSSAGNTTACLSCCGFWKGVSESLCDRDNCWTKAALALLCR